jgi:tRNA-uridine 2-sulfurtransferase
MDKKIVVGMSGGVDSSMSLVLLKEAGWQPIGVSLKLPKWNDKKNLLPENVCCTEESFDIARKICKSLDVPHYVFDVQKDFQKKVIGYFIDDLKANMTPNPCVICNRELKFTKLFEFAKKKNIRYVATGHYARIEKNKKTGEFQLLKAVDLTKDQSYGLSFLKKEWLKNIVLPLGNYTKKQVYSMAKKQGFEFFLKKKQSQDLCFVSKKALSSFIEKEVGENPGEIIDTEGKVIGKHRGLHFYTIGQKRRLFLNGEYYVKGFNNKKNQLIVTLNLDEINRKEIDLKPYNFVSIESPEKIIKVKAKVGYGMELSSAVIYPPEKGVLKIIFDKNKPFVRAGQFCVFYKEDICLGAGIITEEEINIGGLL